MLLFSLSGGGGAGRLAGAATGEEGDGDLTFGGRGGSFGFAALKKPTLSLGGELEGLVSVGMLNELGTLSRLPSRL